jgi:hypothetical protein
MMQWHKWVVLIAGSALRAVCLPNLHITPEIGAISLSRKRDRLSIPFASSHHGPSHPGDLVSQCDSGNLSRSSRQQRGEPRSMPGAMDLCVTNDRERTHSEQAAEIALTLLTNAAELLLATTRALLRY